MRSASNRSTQARTIGPADAFLAPSLDFLGFLVGEHGDDEEKAKVVYHAHEPGGHAPGPSLIPNLYHARLRIVRNVRLRVDHELAKPADLPEMSPRGPISPCF